MEMYRHQIRSFPPYDCHLLESADGRSAIAFIPAHGSLLQLRLKGKDLLAAVQDGAELQLNRWAKGNFLFPFANRLDAGMYSWEGASYQFPVNETDTHTALHGFFGNLAFELQDKDLQPSSGKLVFVREDRSPSAPYPFPNRIRLIFELDSQSGIRIRTEVTNLGEKSMPVCWGWHPYFRLEGPLSTWELQLPACEMVGVDKRMLPTGKKYPFDRFKAYRALGAEVLDNCFALSNQEDQPRIHLRSGAEQLIYSQDNGPGNYPFFQLFIPPDRESLAIEPMTGNINALRSGDGLIVLDPERKESCGWSLQLDRGQ
jgi:aldose 1-epimerase